MNASSTIAPKANDIEDEEAALVREALNDPSAFHALYNRWVIPAYKYFYFRTLDVSRAEDLTSQLFLAVYQSLGHYRHQGHFASWLFTIARNLANKEYRNNRHEVSMELAHKLVSASDPPDEYGQLEETEALKLLILALPIKEQELIRLRYAAGLSFSEIAIVLHKRVDAVKKSVYRLQSKLKSQMEEQNGQNNG